MERALRVARTRDICEVSDQAPNYCEEPRHEEKDEPDIGADEVDGACLGRAIKPSTLPPTFSPCFLGKPYG